MAQMIIRVYRDESDGEVTLSCTQSFIKLPKIQQLDALRELEVQLASVIKGMEIVTSLPSQDNS